MSSSWEEDHWLGRSLDVAPQKDLLGGYSVARLD
jgi:hypothetical protein